VIDWKLNMDSGFRSFVNLTTSSFGSTLTEKLLGICRPVICVSDSLKC